jgi:hypothetical protein
MLLVSLLIASNAYAFEDTAFKLTKHQYNDRMEYAGKQRYSEAVLRNDPEVLVSAPREKAITYTAKKEDSKVQVIEKDPEVLVSACVEMNGECQKSKYFTTAVSQ